MLDKYKAILFDFDYTLGDSSKGICESFNYALLRTGYGAARDQDICKLIGLPLSAMFSTLTQSTDQLIIDRFIVYFRERAEIVIAKEAFIYSGVPILLRTLRLQDKKLGVVSTKSRLHIQEILVNHNLDNYFDVVVGGQDVKKHKPDPEGILLAIDSLSMIPNNVLYIGDTIIDAQAAKNASIHFIPVLSGTTIREDFQDYHPSHILNNIEELLNL